jgi:hypothetical protein
LRSPPKASLTNDPFLRLTSDSVLGHKQYREGGAPGLKEVLASHLNGQGRGSAKENRTS